MRAASARACDTQYAGQSRVCCAVWMLHAVDLCCQAHLLHQGEEGAGGDALRQVGMHVLAQQEGGTLALIHPLHRPSVRVLHTSQRSTHGQQTLAVRSQVRGVVTLGIHLRFMLGRQAQCREVRNAGAAAASAAAGSAP
jgi:hypothetical protein